MTAGLIIGLAALLLADPPVHSPPTGSRIDPFPGAVGLVESEDAVTARRVMNTYGRCVARTRDRMARAVLALPLRSDQQHAAVRRAVGGADGCMGMNYGRLAFQPPLLVGAMAEYYAAERMGSRDLQPIAALTDARLAEMGIAPRTGYEDVATCIAVRDPAAVMALISTQPGTEQESSAFRRLVPHLGPCLPQGLTFTLNPGQVRALVAVGLYRVLVATGNPREAAR